MRKTRKAGDLVMEFCAVTCSTARACMSSDQHRDFVECDVDPEMLSAAEADLMLTSVSQVLKSKSDISGKAEVKAAANAFTDETGALLAKKKDTM